MWTVGGTWLGPLRVCWTAPSEHGHGLQWALDAQTQAAVNLVAVGWPWLQWTRARADLDWAATAEDVTDDWWSL